MGILTQYYHQLGSRTAQARIVETGFVGKDEPRAEVKHSKARAPEGKLRIRVSHLVQATASVGLRLSAVEITARAGEERL